MSERKDQTIEPTTPTRTLEPFKVEIKGTSAVGSVDNIAQYVVGDQSTVTSIRDTVCSLDVHDLTAVRNRTNPPDVAIPDNEASHALAASYAEAELTERSKRSAKWKTWGGWVVAIAVALIAVIARGALA